MRDLDCKAVRLTLMLALGSVAPPGELANAQGIEAKWTRVWESPFPRAYPACVYDSRRERLLVFGGCKRFGSHSDVWSLPLRPGGDWELLAPGYEGPGSNSCYTPAAVYDSLEDRLLVVHPGDYSRGPGDTVTVHAYRFGAQPGWQKLETFQLPPTRPADYLEAFLDPGERRLVVMAREIWSLDLDSRTWSQWAPLGAAPKKSLSGCAAALDTRRRRVLLNGGGHFGEHFSSATWAFSLEGTGRWDSLHVPPTSPGRRDHAAVFDPREDRLVIAGGHAGDQELLDAWALDLASGGSWESIHAPVPELSKRFTSGAIYDPGRHALVLHGGRDGSNDLVATVSLPLHPSGQWQVSPPIAEPVYAASMVHDPVRHRMIRFGGMGPNGNARDRLDALDLTPIRPAWSRVVWNGNGPLRRHSHAAAWDSQRHRMLVFGGIVDATNLNDLWAYDPEASTPWTLVPTTGMPPSGRADCALAYDPARDRLLMIGGRAIQSSGLIQYYGELWELPFSGPSALQWRVLSPTGTPPTLPHGCELVYDAAEDRMYLAGGRHGSSRAPTFVLQFGPTSGDGVWQSLGDAGFFGGYPLVIGRPDEIVLYFDSGNQTRSLALGAARWDTVVVSSTVPTYRTDMSGAYDPVSDRMVVSGGHFNEYLGSEYVLSDTWLLTWLGPGTVDAAPAINAAGVEIHGVSPHPVRRSFELSLSLASPDPAHVELLDVSGRRRFSRFVEGRPGPGQVRIDLDAGLPAGMYFVRVRQGVHQAAKRVCVVR